MGSRDSFTNYPYGNIFFFLSLFLVNMPLNCNKCAEGILNFVQEFGVRTDLQRSWFHQVKLFLSFLICEAKTGPTSKLFRLEIRFETFKLSACADCILNFVQEFGVRTDLQRSWFHQVKLFLSFLICGAKTVPTSKLFRLHCRNWI